MIKSAGKDTGALGCDRLLDYPAELRLALRQLARHQPMYVAGGAVRDWLMGLAAGDLDFTVAGGALACARELARLLDGTFVLLDADEDVARVVWRGLTLDVSAFRNGSVTIEEDLCQRDFTVNSMAVSLDPESGGLAPDLRLIDPLGGAADLAAMILRANGEAGLLSDPLRLLRAYRFMATLGFVIDRQTAALIIEHGRLLLEPAKERVRHELDLLMGAPGAFAAIKLMARHGLLRVLFPELALGCGLIQPASHHLDVFEHSLEALAFMEKILALPGLYFPGQDGAFALDNAGNTARLLKWAALFHDLGKPGSQRLLAGRITFYNHDRIGAAVFSAIADRFRWAGDDRRRVAKLIAMHMWPFHLSNARRRLGRISRKACLRLVRAAGPDLASLFALAMADSLAGQGAEKPLGLEADLAALFSEVGEVYDAHIQPTLAGPPLLNGHDLTAVFSLKPGPLFREILDGLLVARVEGLINDRTQALLWVENFLSEKGR